MGDLNKLLSTVKAVLFDLDGTMLNSEPLHSMALFNLLKESKNHNVTDLQKEFVGLSDDDVYFRIKEKEDLYMNFEDFKLKKTEAFFHLLEEIEDPTSYLNPGLLSFLKTLNDRDIFLGVVSASHKAIGEMLLKKFGLDSFFKIKIFREDTFLTKPDPSPYLKASRDLKIKTNEVLIFEDSKVGLESAVSSGAQVVQITTFCLNIPEGKNLKKISTFLELLNPH